jgi:hypothetical protein
MRMPGRGAGGRVGRRAGGRGFRGHAVNDPAGWALGCAGTTAAELPSLQAARAGGANALAHGALLGRHPPNA